MRAFCFVLLAGCTGFGVYGHPHGHPGDDDGGPAPDGGAWDGGELPDGGIVVGEDGGVGFPLDVFENCDVPDGPLHPYTQASELSQLVVGRWVRCSGASLLDDGDSDAGIEVDGNGTYSMLASDGGSGLVTLTGFGNQGTWDVQQTGDTADWELETAPGVYVTLDPELEDDPQKFAVSVGGSGAESIYAIVPALMARPAGGSPRAP